MGRRGLLLLVIGVFGVLLAAAVFSGSAVKADSSVELVVGNLTCGSCVEKIRGSLADLEGIGAVEVDLATGRTRVAYDGTRTDAAAIVGQISRAGYPVASSPQGAVPAATGATGCPAAKPAKPAKGSGCGGGCCG